MRFQNPMALNWLIGVIPLWFIWLKMEKSGMQKFAKFLSTIMMSRLAFGFSTAKRKRRVVLLLIAYFFAILSYARPQIGNHEEDIKSQGLDIVFVLDVSNSMLTEDVVPNRMKKAKHIIKNFVDKLSSDRVGVVAFAGSSYPAIPMTSDYHFIKQTLEVIDEKIILNQGTDLNKALITSFEMLKRGAASEALSNSTVEIDNSDEAESSQSIIFLSDGEDTVGDEVNSASLIAKRGVRVYSIGVGSFKGAPIPIRDENGSMKGFKRDRSGNVVLSKLQSKPLEEMAKAGKGKYFNATLNEEEIDVIIKDMSGLEREDGVARKVIVYDEYFQIPLAVALFFIFIFLFGTEFVVPAKVLSLIFLIFIFTNSGLADDKRASSISEYSSSKDGKVDYQLKNYPEALRKFGAAQAENPANPQHRHNMGSALFKTGNYSDAAKQFEGTLKSTNDNEAAKGAYNLGRSHQEDKNYDQAINSFQKGLDRQLTAKDPDPEVINRLKKALQIVEQQKQQKQKDDQDKKDKKDGKGNKDQNDQNKEDDKNKKEDEKDKNQKMQMPKKKFKQENLTEADASRILKQLQEQEKKVQSKMMRVKQGRDKAKPLKVEKDW